MQAAITWILALLTYAAPPDRLSDAMPGWEETPEARRARYESIAADIAATNVSRSLSNCSRVTTAFSLSWSTA